MMGKPQKGLIVKCLHRTYKMVWKKDFDTTLEYDKKKLKEKKHIIFLLQSKKYIKNLKR